MSSFSNLKWSFYGKGGSWREGTDILIEYQGILYQNIAKGKIDQRVVCLCRINCVNNYNWLSTSQFSSAAKHQGHFQSCQLSWSYCQCFPEQHWREHNYQNMHLHHHQALRTSVWADFFISQTHFNSQQYEAMFLRPYSEKTQVRKMVKALLLINVKGWLWKMNNAS